MLNGDRGEHAVRLVGQLAQHVCGVLRIARLAENGATQRHRGVSAQHRRPRPGLLGQAEHGYNSPAVLVTNSRRLGEATLSEIDRILKVLPTAETASASWRDYGEVIVCDGNGSVRCSSKSQVNVDVIENGWIVKDEILDILHVVVENGGVREREMCVSLDLTRMSSAISGRGVTAGSSAPSDSYLRVRVGHICDGLYAVFINDVTEQRRFERMRRDFVTNVSHELKTPAGAISLLAETVSDAADDPGAVRYFAGRITKESARLTELVTHLIELQRAQDAPAMLKAQRISAMSVVRAAVGENLVQAGAKHIAIRLSLRGEQAPVDADAAADDEAQHDIAIMVDRETLTMAVKNLVENAIRYSPEYTTVSVSVSLCKDPSSMTIRVIDQGIGIPSASLDRVFERFYRVDPARSRATGGSGLGLAITKHCVQECGGTISVWSREGEGSTFTIELPVAPEPDDDDGERADDGEAPGETVGAPGAGDAATQE